MLGASQRIHADALPMFTGKRVRIFGHDDEAGRGAVERWAAQLASVGADVDAFSFAGLVQADGKPVKDLNDSLLMDAGEFRPAWKGCCHESTTTFTSPAARHGGRRGTTWP